MRRETTCSIRVTATRSTFYEENRAMGDARDTAKKKKADEKKGAAKKPAAKTEAKAAPKAGKK